jgi:hypothetical protein
MMAKCAVCKRDINIPPVEAAHEDLSQITCSFTCMMALQDRKKS